MNDLYVGKWIIRPRFNEIVRNGEAVRIPPKYMEVLLCLAERPGDVWTREELLDRVWPDTFVVEASLTRAVHELRKVLETDPSNPELIRTIPKRGYILTEARPFIELPEGAEAADQPNVANEKDAREQTNRVYWGAAGIAALFFIATSTVTKFDSTASFPYALLADPRPLTSLQGDEYDPALSPDGRFVAFAWTGDQGENADIYVKEIANGAVRRLVGTKLTERRPVWSPDGREIAFVQCGPSTAALLTVDQTGGTPEQLTELRAETCSSISGMSWSADGDWIAFADIEPAGHAGGNGVHAVSRRTGERILVTSPSEPHVQDRMPVFSPNGDLVAFVRGGPRGQEIYQVTIGGGEPTLVTTAPFLVDGVDWSPDGRNLIFASNGNLWYVPTAGGEPSLMAGSSSYDGQPSLARHGGQLAYVSSSLDVNVWQFDVKANAQERPSRMFASTRIDGDPAISPDGNSIAFISDRDGMCGIWTSDRNETHLSELVSFNHDCMEMATPRWSPDGEKLAYIAYTHGQTDVYTVDVATRVTSRLSDGAANEAAPSWSNDGSKVYFSSNRAGIWQLYRVGIDGGQSERVSEHEAFFSSEDADGRYVYFTRPAHPGLFRMSVDGGVPEVVVDHLDPLDDANWRLAQGGVYFVNRLSGEIPRMEFLDFASSTRTLLAELPIKSEECIRTDVSPDGEWAVFARVDHGGRDLFIVNSAKG